MTELKYKELRSDPRAVLKQILKPKNIKALGVMEIKGIKYAVELCVYNKGVESQIDFTYCILSE